MLEGKFKNKIGLGLGFLTFILFSIFQIFPDNPKASFTLSIALLMAILWISEAIPLSITSLLPVILFPSLGILSGKAIAEAYINNTILLFLGGFLIAISFEKWGLHRRIALFIIAKIGSKPSTLILAFMIASAFLSMFISNTATAVMIIPVGLAIINKIENVSEHYSRKFNIALLLSIAYACSLGGIATLIGTPPNLVFHRIYSIYFPEAQQVSFAQWLAFGLPLSLIMLIITWVLITKIIYKDINKLFLNKQTIKQEYKLLGKQSFEEKVTFIIFAFAVLLWIFRADIELGDFIIPGWSNIFSNSEMIDDSTVAIAISFLLFLIPSKNQKGSFILDEQAIFKVPWGVLLLFGGGFALAKGFQDSGLSELLCSQLTNLKDIPEFLILLIVISIVTFLTELTSNTAVANTILPIAALMSKALGIHPLTIMIPVTIASSFAFMMPVATPPNAIVFGTGKLRILDMVKVGFYLNLIAIVVLCIYVIVFSKIFWVK